MTRFLISRAAQSVLVICVVYTCTFWLLMAAPGNPFIGVKQPPPAIIHALKVRYGLNNRWHAYWAYPWRFITRGDLGPTISYANWTVLDVIRSSLPISVSLGVMALLIALWLGVGLGMLGALTRGHWPDLALTVGSLLGISVPSFVIGSILLLVFSTYWALLPSGGWGDLAQVILPAGALAVGFLAYIARLTRIGMLDEFSADYVRTARAKGVPPGRVMVGHILPNATLPVLSFLGPAAAALLTGSFVVEKIFAIPGMGEDFVNACLDKDIPLVLGIVMVYTVLLVAFNLLVDIAYVFADPRISLHG